jgi:hypothetical protein
MIYVLRYPGIGLLFLLSLCYEIWNNILGKFFTQYSCLQATKEGNKNNHKVKT